MEAEIIKWGAYVITGVLGWFLRSLWQAQKELRQDLSALRQNLSENYVPKKEYREYISELKESIKDMLEPVFRKLDKQEELLIQHLMDNKKQ